jgi:hypothetical protein
MFADSSKSTFGAHMDVAAESSRLPTPLFQHVNEILKYYLFRKRQFGSSLVLSFCVCPGQGLKVFKKTSQFRIVSKIFEPTNRRFHTKQTMLKLPPKLKFSSPIPIQLAPRFVFPHNIFLGCSPNFASPTRPPLATPGSADKFAGGNFHLPPRESQPTGPPLLQ